MYTINVCELHHVKRNIKIKKYEYICIEKARIMKHKLSEELQKGIIRKHTHNDKTLRHSCRI